MKEFLPRNDAVNVAAIAPPQAVQPVLRVQPTAAATGERDDNATSLTKRAPVPQAPQTDEAKLSSAAEFARAHQKIAALLADMRSSDAPDTVPTTEAAINNLIPTPTVIIPLPPASPEQMERAIEIAKAIRADAMLARAAQAHMKTDSIDAVFS